jgi:WD40 repeat protein
VELAREREQRRLSDEQRKISDQQRKISDQQRKVSIAVGFGLAGLAVFAFGAAQQAAEQRKRAEISEIKALDTFSEILSTSGRTFDALMESLRAAERLSGVDGVGAADTRVRTAAMLQQTVYDVKEYNSLEKHGSGVYSVSFSPDGKTIASGSGDKTIKLWNLDFDELLAQSCKWLQNYMTIHPEALEELKQCQTKSLLRAAAPVVVQKGRTWQEKETLRLPLLNFVRHSPGILT